MFFYRTQHTLFLDIGHYLAKAAYVTRSGNSFTIQKFEKRQVPEKIFENAQITHPLKFKEFLHQLLRAFPESAQTGTIHLTASDRHTFLKKIVLPTPLPKNLDQHMLYEAEQMAPYPIAEAIVDYSIMDNDPYFATYAQQGESQILTTLSKQSILSGIKDLFEEIDRPLSVVSPGSIGLFNVGLRRLHTKEFDRLILAHMGDVSTLLLFISPQHVRFLYYPTGLRESILAAAKLCDLSLSEGRYFAENLTEKNVPELFVSAFQNSLNRTCENLGSQMVNLSEANPEQSVPVYFSGGPVRLFEVEKQFLKFPELRVTSLTYTPHLVRKNIRLSNEAWATDIATFFPALIGHLEALGT